MDPVNFHRLLYIFELLVARIFERYVNFAAYLPEGVVRYANAARLGEAFESRGNVDAVAENISLLDDDIADVNADADFNTLVGRDILFCVGPGSHNGWHQRRCRIRSRFRHRYA